MACGLFFPLLTLWLPRQAVIISLAVITIVFVGLDIVRFFIPGLSQWAFRNFRLFLRDSETATLTGASYLLISSLIIFILFPVEIAILSLVFLAVGDPLAGIIGRRFGRTRLLKKSLEGTTACLCGCVAVGLVFYQAGLGLALLSVLAGAVTAALAELVPLPLNDNLRIPISASLVMLVMEAALR